MTLSANPHNSSTKVLRSKVGAPKRTDSSLTSTDWSLRFDENLNDYVACDTWQCGNNQVAAKIAKSDTGCFVGYMNDKEVARGTSTINLMRRLEFAAIAFSEFAKDDDRHRLVANIGNLGLNIADDRLIADLMR